MLKIFNTMTGQKEPFEPLETGKVRMYVCGVTVYDDCHLGHARSAVVFDVIRRYLEYRGYEVNFVKNFTDVDDKIINRAAQLGIPWQDVTSRYIDAYYRDMGRLGVLKATVEPRATEHMDDIIKLVRALIEKGVAYQVDGDVYFQVAQDPAYGRLSKRKLDEMQAGARVEVDERKRHPMDFALWKAAKPGEPFWDSPWGPGRPGWHIECSAMSMKHLGETFDIHGGGADLIFPHHENEIAQSCAATGKEFARYWLHNGFVQINQEKMSKSLGNFFTIKEIFEKWHLQWEYRTDVIAETLRYYLLTTHYRSPLDFSDQSLKEAKNAATGFYNLFDRLKESEGRATADKGLMETIERCRSAFREAMDDDFNTPVAIAALQGLRSDVSKMLDQGLSTEARKTARKEFRSLGNILGLFQLDKWQFGAPIDQAMETDTAQPIQSAKSVSASANISAEALQGVRSPLQDNEIECLLVERNEARRQKNFKRADEIRKELAAQGIILEDRPDGTTRWKR